MLRRLFLTAALAALPGCSPYLGGVFREVDEDEDEEEEGRSASRRPQAWEPPTYDPPEPTAPQYPPMGRQRRRRGGPGWQPKPFAKAKRPYYGIRGSNKED